MEIKNISKSFDNKQILNNFSYLFESNKVTAILGPSGCGKTTILRILSGLLKPDYGNVVLKPNESFSYIFQEPRLLPWLNVTQNCNLVLENIITDKEKRNKTIKKYLKLVELEEYIDKYPDQLSGGMKQRVALVRAFAYPSNILLMDEPFQAIDLRLKLDLVYDFNKIWEQDKRTTVFVTHDIQEALILGDTVLIIDHKPAEIIKIFKIDIPKSQRHLDNEDLIKLEKLIYSILLKK